MGIFNIRDSHLFTCWLSSLFKMCSPSCVCAWVGRRQAWAVDPPAPRGAVAPIGAPISPATRRSRVAGQSLFGVVCAEPGRHPRAVGGYPARRADERTFAMRQDPARRIYPAGHNALARWTIDTARADEPAERAQDCVRHSELREANGRGPSRTRRSDSATSARFGDAIG